MQTRRLETQLLYNGSILNAAERIGVQRIPDEVQLSPVGVLVMRVERCGRCYCCATDHGFRGLCFARESFVQLNLLLYLAVCKAASLELRAGKSAPGLENVAPRSWT